MLVWTCDMVNKTVSFSVYGSFEPPLTVAFDKIVPDSIAPALSDSTAYGLVGQ